MSVTLRDLSHTDGSDNTAGIQQNVYFAKLEDILTLPKPVLDDSTGSGNLSDLVTISSNIVMKPEKQFYKLYCTLEAGELKNDAQGELDGMSFMNQLEVFLPGSSAEALGFAQWVKNSNLIILVPESDGQVRVLGHEGYPAKLVNMAGTTGKVPADRKGMTYTFKSTRKGPSPIFTGRVSTSGSGFGSGALDVNGDGYQDIYFID